MSGYLKLTIWMFVWIIILQMKCCEEIKLPEDIEDIEINGSYACYGCHKNFVVDKCENDSVIVIQAIKAGAKLKTLGCPDDVQTDQDQCHNETCCMPDVTKDCIGYYSYSNSGLDYTYHRGCSGKQTCDLTQVSHMTNTCNQTYMSQTNYMFAEYACVQRSKIFDMCMASKYYSSTITNNTVYLQTPAYPDDMDGIGSDCFCNITADNTNIVLDIYLIHVQLYLPQVLTINGTSSGNVQYDNSSATMFNITKHELQHGANITLKKLSASYSGTKLWFGLKERNGVPFMITCVELPTKPQVSPVKDQGPRDKNLLALILGSIFGVLLLLALLFCFICYMCKRKKKRKIESTEDAEEGDVPNHMLETREDTTVMNSRFNTTRIPPVNKVAPTRHIEEHGGLGRRLPPIAGTIPVISSLPPDGPRHHLQPIDKESQPAKKHKKKKKKRKHKSKDPNKVEVVNDIADRTEAQNGETDV